MLSNRCALSIMDTTKYTGDQYWVLLQQSTLIIVEIESAYRPMLS